MLDRLRPRTFAGWSGWAAFVITFAIAIWMSRDSPLGFRLADVPAYLVFAVLAAGFYYAFVKVIAFARSESGNPVRPPRPSFDQEIAESFARISARAEADGEEARRVRAEPWHADAVVDLNQVAARWFAAGHAMADTILIVPNPYFVLPLDAIVKWGFATAVEVREAVRWAVSTTPPVRWQNPPLRERLNCMGWSDPEAYARIGLFFWRTDPEAPDPASAAIEAKVRADGQVYDVPRPASL
jgi:hypothetical protein